MLATLLLAAAQAAATPAAEATALPAAPVAATPVDYAREESWLCRPGRQDACAVNLDATIVAADGTTTLERFVPATNPKADCFYVYPTVSTDTTPNSDMTADPAETGVAAAQFARFGSVCRTFAPLYRQITLSALRATMLGQPMRADGAMAYGDVRAAFRDYMARDNKGRPFVLVGHSQGSRMLQQLVKDEIDGKPVQNQMLSAMMIGFNMLVPVGKDVGGDFRTVPLCRSATQTGCAISYVSFRDTAPPPPKSRFGRASDPAMQVACVNPAALADTGRVTLDAYMGTAGAGLSSAPPAPWVKGETKIATSFVKVPGLLSGQCVSSGGSSYLAVSVNGVPADPRTDTITGEVLANGAILADWGLHLIDVSVAQGDLIKLVQSQAGAWR